MVFVAGRTGASFEEAIAATGYSKFNILLLMAVTLPCFVQMFESMNLSYVVPVAQCDLELRLEDKGILNAVCFIGICIFFSLWLDLIYYNYCLLCMSNTTI